MYGVTRKLSEDLSETYGTYMEHSHPTLYKIALYKGTYVWRPAYWHYVGDKNAIWDDDCDDRRSPWEKLIQWVRQYLD